MKKSNFFLIGIVIFSITISGCSRVADSKDSCKLDSDCQDKKCMNKLCENKMCNYNPISNCCGNGIKEDIEDGVPGSSCSCPEDYGPCQGPVNEYLEYVCNEDLSCAMEVKKSLLKLLTKTNNVDLDKISLAIVSTYNQPFNLKKDTINIDFLVKSMSELINEFKIKKITLLMREKQDRMVKLGEKEVEKYLWDVGDKVEEKLIPNFVTNNTSNKLKDLIIQVDYEYIKLSKTRSTTSKIMDSFTFGYGGSEFVYTNPPIEYTCPFSCDDENPATKDYCSKETNFFCYHKFIPDKCGNYLCEESENKCTCSIDCGKCRGDYKSYMKWQCVNDQCVTIAKDKPKRISIVDERNFDGFHISLKYNYDAPFDVNASIFDIEMKYLSMDKKFSYFVVNRINILEGDILLGLIEKKMKIDTHPNNISTISIPMSFKLEENKEETKDITVKIDYYYSNEEGEGEKTYKKKFYSFIFFNPEYR